MKRLIKFRAWGRTPESDTPAMTKPFDFRQYVMYHEGAQSWLLPTVGEDVVYMQYTGLEDKNGVEIYEGDILSSPSMPNSPVEFQCGSFNAVYADGSHDEWEAPLWRYSVEVIGNIYEHGHLLEANQ